MVVKRKKSAFYTLLIVAFLIVTYICKGQALVFSTLCNKSVVYQLLSDGAPVFYKYNQVNTKLVLNSMLGFDISSPLSVIKSNVYAFSAFEQKEEVVKEPVEEQPDMTNAKPIKEYTISYKNPKGYYEAQGVLVKNETSYNFNVQELLDEPLKFNFNEKGPQVLIVHSHSSESYTPTDKNYYLPTDPDRTEDTNYNVVRVGTEITNTLKSYGIEVVHATKLHDYPSYNGSYKNSLATVQEYLKKYPSIKIVLDIHRDAMVQSDGTKLKLVADVQNKKAAQIMLLSGSDQGGLDHPYWRENLKFAIKLQRTVNSMYPGLARPVSFTKERYNTHTTYASIIIEVGTTGNTLEEALVSARMVGSSVATFIKTN